MPVISAPDDRFACFSPNRSQDWPSATADGERIANFCRSRRATWGTAYIAGAVKLLRYSRAAWPRLTSESIKRRLRYESVFRRSSSFSA